jgi:hypothetical protein
MEIKKIATSLLLPIISLFTSCVNISAQDNGDKYLHNLHLDKYSYLPGETVFFKIYTHPVSALVNPAITISLINEKYQIEASKILLLSNGTAGSYFEIPVTDTNRFFIIQYYCSGSKKANLKSTIIYRKRNCEEQLPISASLDTTIAFFPEAGKLVNSLTNTIIFKIPQDLIDNINELKGKILDTNNDSIAPFETAFRNFGKTEILLESGKKYFAVFNTKDKANRVQLPIASETNYTLLNLYMVKNAVAYRVRTTKEEKFSLEIYNNGIMFYKATFDLKPQENMAKTLPDSFLQKGNNFFFLKNSKGEVLNERVYNKYDHTDLEPLISDTIVNKTVIIKFPNNIAMPLSISIVNTNTVLKDSPDINHRLSFKNVKKIFESRYKEDEDKWKEWADIIEQTNDIKMEKELQETKGNIEITVSDKEENRLLKNLSTIVLLKNSDSTRKVIKLTTDENARLFIDRSFVKDSATIYCYQPLNKYPKYNIALNLINQPVSVFKLQNISLPSCLDFSEKKNDFISNAITVYNQQQKAKTLQEVTIKVVKKTEKELIEEQYASGMYQSKVHQLMDFDFINDNQNQFLGNIETFLSYRVPRVGKEIEATKPLGGYSFYINENVADLSLANNIPISDIAYISVMGRNFVPLTGDMGPAILIYTKKGNASINQNNQSNSKITVKGYATDKAYFNKLFDDQIIENKYRGTIYWNSNVKIDSNNTINCPLLYAPDQPIQISIEGYDNDGNFLSYSKIIFPVLN